MWFWCFIDKDTFWSIISFLFYVRVNFIFSYFWATGQVMDVKRCFETPRLWEKGGLWMGCKGAHQYVEVHPGKKV